jgi:beta-phosphoglucomutase-like phosphatase (HAD superfamily)
MKNKSDTTAPAIEPLRAVIFDMDGLMLDTENIYRAAWQKAARECDFEISDELYERFTGRPIPDCEALLLQVLAPHFPALPARMDEFRARRRDAWMSHVATHGIGRKKGLHALLKYLEERGVRRSIATSSGREDAQACLGDLAAHFEAMTNGPEVAHGKPAPDIFLLALERAGLRAEECLVLEDSEAGVQAAHAAGLRVIMVPDLKEPSDEARSRAWRVCADLDEVREVLASRADEMRS